MSSFSILDYESFSCILIVPPSSAKAVLRMKELIAPSERDCHSGSLDKIRSLPPFHPVASQVLSLFSTANDGFQLDEIARILGGDPAFAAEMLQTANSPLFGLKCSVHTVGRAIIVLGLERTKALAVRTAMQIYLSKALDHPVLHRGWLHSLACAEIARTMMRACGQASEDQAYTGGLLHDIGRLALLTAFRAQYVPVLTQAYGSAEEIIGSEVNTLGLDHCRAGHELCGLWSFPHEIDEIVLRHHEPLSGRENSLLNIVRISCQLADCLGFSAVKYHSTPTYEQLIARMSAEMRGRFEFSVDQLRQIVNDRVGSAV